ncbi:EF-hand domain-containing protein [Devosia sp.]|jgi:hypothetical protein|uniref:EF-hand domain-containing protein n=1 Tax=Devosia sp. TaxID=1871048 RepID=UPI001AD24CBB|nr:EF-hand domain-containing protein [Devosia sp.]MBN9333043.1 hypothetical protein [Devosia sp.]
MRKLALGLVAASFIAAPVLAQTPLTFADVDANGDGRLSYEELLVVWPDLTAEEFAAADAEGVGGLTPEQLNMLQPASVPAPAEAVPAPLEAPAPTDSLTN